MSLLIKGMDMPKNNGLFYDLLLSLSFDGSGEIFFNRKSYPIVEIPTPHGRLIDADAYQYSGDLIDEPTIIEAEQGDG